MFKESLVGEAKKLNIGEDDILQIYSIVINLLIEKNVNIVDYDFHYTDDITFFSIYVNKPINEIFDLNWALSGEIVKLDYYYSDKMMIEISSYLCI